MSLDAAVNEVIEITRRADKESLIRNRINATLRKFSGLARFPRNLSEFTEQNNANEAVVTIALPSRFQAVSYLRPASCDQGLVALNPQTTYSEDYGYYITGNNILVRHPHNEDVIHYGLYIHPADLVNPADTNWILDTFFELVVEIVSAKVQGILGNNEAAVRLMEYSREFMLSEMHNYVSPYGD